eukprot:TRINITY_DN5036_c0_g1_i27.p1 TRINITY_DN5036_c0_g1~~TRINITY_DN5036_c0_g1_i27.p1  ORF type:complete len:387 (+),score=98.58 TRINITY_DN5036_c0_g1_i27:377-1537(+)
MYMSIDKANANRSAENHIVINHLENINGMCTKTGLIKSLTRFYKSALEPTACKYTVHDSVPSTFVVLPNCNDAEYQSFLKHFNYLDKKLFRREKVPAKHCGDNIWLIKPAAMNQGKGIEIFRNDLAGMKKFLESKPQNSYWVVQKYIEKPLLYEGRKFDIRMWAVMTCKGEFYFYKHGYIRTSSDFYSLDSKTNYVHLTNNCLQQFGDKYGAFEEGNTIEFPIFKQYLKQKFPEYDIDLDKHIMGRIKDLMIDSYLAVKSELNPNKRKNCFELLGYDFLIDEDFRVWLIEVNTNPYLGVPNNFIKGLLPKMINDLLEIVLDPCIKPANPLPPRGIFPASYSVEIENQFELLYDEKRKINKRRSYAESIYPIAELIPVPPVAFPLNK